MIKIIGAILIIVATTWTGFEISRHLVNDQSSFVHLKTALQSLGSRNYVRSYTAS